MREYVSVLAPLLRGEPVEFEGRVYHHKDVEFERFVALPGQTMVVGGMLPSWGLMMMNSAIENHIRKQETFKITSAIQTNAKRGMILLDDFIWRLYKEGKIPEEEALLKAQNVADMKKRLSYSQLGGDDDGNGGGNGEDEKKNEKATIGGLFTRKSGE